MRLRPSEGSTGLRWKGWGQRLGHRGPPSSGEGRGWWGTGDKVGIILKKNANYTGAQFSVIGCHTSLREVKVQTTECAPFLRCWQSSWYKMSNQTNGNGAISNHRRHIGYISAISASKSTMQRE